MGCELVLLPVPLSLLKDSQASCEHSLWEYVLVLPQCGAQRAFVAAQAPDQGLVCLCFIYAKGSQLLSHGVLSSFYHPFFSLTLSLALYLSPHLPHPFLLFFYSFLGFLYLLLSFLFSLINYLPPPPSPLFLFLSSLLSFLYVLICLFPFLPNCVLLLRFSALRCVSRTPW